MSEIYRDATGKSVKLGVVGATDITAKFVKGGKTHDAVVTGDTAAIPYAVVSSDGQATVQWEYTMEGNVYKRAENFEVVTPLFYKEDLIDADGAFATLSDAQILTLERFVRLIIQSYTGQRFGLEYGTINLRGDGGSVLQSDRRIISLEGQYSAYPYSIINNGYAIETSRAYRTEYKAGWPAIYHDEDSGLTPWDDPVAESYRTGPIISPYTFRPFANNITYSVTGMYGWESVPENVKQAALVLAGEFSCNEATWRDRYIKSIRAADWRFDFDSRAYHGTGSASADLLLSEYVVSGMAVI